MGNTVRAESVQPYNDFIIQSELRQIHLGSIRLLQSKHERHSKYIEKTFSFIALEKAQAFLSILQSRKDQDHPNLAKLESIKSEQDTRGLSRVKLIFKLYNRQISQLIQEKSEREALIWSIARQINNVLQFFQQQQCFHGDLNLYTVFLQESTVKIHDPLYFQRLSGSQLLSLSRANRSFLPPQLYYLALQHNFHAGQLDVRCDIFSFGVILLSLALNKNCIEMFQHGFPNLQKLRKEVDKVCQFSVDLAEIIKKCISDFKDRPFPSQLDKLMNERDKSMFERLPLCSSLTNWSSEDSSIRQSVIEQRYKFEESTERLIKSITSEQLNTKQSDKGMIVMDFSEKENMKTHNINKVQVAPFIKEKQNPRRIEDLEQKIQAAIQLSNQTLSRHNISL